MVKLKSLEKTICCFGAAVCALRWGSAGRKMFAALRNRMCSRRAAAAAWMLLLLPAVSLLLVVPSRRNFQSCRCLTLFQILDPEMRGSFPLWAQGCTHLGHLSCSQLHESLCSLICPAATQCSDGGDTPTKRALLVAKMGTLCLHSSSDIIDVKKITTLTFWLSLLLLRDAQKKKWSDLSSLWNGGLRKRQAKHKSRSLFFVLILLKSRRRRTWRRRGWRRQSSSLPAALYEEM